MEELTYGGAALSVILVGIVQAFKKAGIIPDQYAGVLSIVIGGIVGAMFSNLFEVPYTTGIVAGLASGAMASGWYSNVKNLTEKQQ